MVSLQKYQTETGSILRTPHMKTRWVCFFEVGPPKFCGLLLHTHPNMKPGSVVFSVYPRLRAKFGIEHRLLGSA